MRISDWSSDVCSSDLQRQGKLGRMFLHALGQLRVQPGQARRIVMRRLLWHGGDFSAASLSGAAKWGRRDTIQEGEITLGCASAIILRFLCDSRDRKSTRLNSSH